MIASARRRLRTPAPAVYPKSFTHFIQSAEILGKFLTLGTYITPFYSHYTGGLTRFQKTSRQALPTVERRSSNGPSSRNCHR